MNREYFKKLLLSIKEQDYKSGMYDLHIHSNESDGSMNPVEILEKAHKNNKKLISVTDHNTIEAYISTNILSDYMVIAGVEFDCLHKGIPIHILGYGFNIDDNSIKNLLAASVRGRKNKIYRLFNQRNPKEVIEKIAQAGGVSILAHPACYWCKNLEDFIKSLIDIGLDGIETYYPYRGFRRIVKFHSSKTVKQIADKYNIIKTGGSDSHGKKLKPVISQ